MRYVKAFFLFWYDFIVGDAWEVAAGVVISLAVLALALHYLGDPAQTLGAFLLPLALIWIIAAVLLRTSYCDER